MVSGPGEVIAGYAVESVLGTGGMGTVYKVRHPTLPRSVALKVLHEHYSGSESVRSRFLREAEIVAGLNHPGIVDVYDRGESDGHLWIAMRLVDGEDLATIAGREGPFGLDRAVAVIDQVADALDHAHQHGVLHRDVKPANFLVERGRRGERVMLADFGIGAAQNEVGQHTEAGTVVGTLAYTAPEALLGAPVDQRADIYSLACAAVVLLTGAPPFTTTVSGALIMAHIGQPPPSIRIRRPDLSPEVDHVLARALAKNPADRFHSAGEFAAALSAAARRMSGGAVMPPPGPPPVNWQGSASNPAQATGAALPAGPVGPGGPGGPGQRRLGGPAAPGGPPTPSNRKRNRAMIGGAIAVVVVLIAAVIGVFAFSSDTGADYDGPALNAWTPRTVEDAAGRTKIEQRPAAIVALGPTDAEIVVALGFEVVAGANGDGQIPGWVPGAGEIPSAGTAAGPDMSAIAAAKPDLIIDTAADAAPVISELRALAPTITRPESAAAGWNWRRQLDFIAEALGATDRAKKLENTYDTKMVALKNAHPAWQDVKADLLHFNGSATLQASKEVSGADVLRGLGFSVQTPVKGTGAWVPISGSDLYSAVGSYRVDLSVVVRTDPGAKGGGYGGLPDALTTGSPIVIVDSAAGAEAMLTGGPLSVEVIGNQVVPAIVKVKS